MRPQGVKDPPVDRWDALPHLIRRPPLSAARPVSGVTFACWFLALSAAQPPC